MCGTPFPPRALTGPDVQSTLDFTSVPLEIARSSQLPRVPEPQEPQTVAALAAAEELAPVAEPHPPEPVVVREEVPVVEPQELPQEAAPEPAAFAESEVQPATILEVAPEEPAAIVDAAFEAAHEVEAPLAAELVEAAQETVEEPEPIIAEPEQVPESERVAAPEPVAKPEPVAEVEAPREAEIEAPPEKVITPAARVIVMPTPRSQPTALPAGEAPAAKPGVIHPSPESLPFTPPPASAGMPTFQEVVEAAGPPPISPFEPPPVKHTDEDRELQEYIASFSYTPPAETADELTMRSEMPVVDEAAPAEFHHPSFDDDVPPPPEAGPHPTGEEYYQEGHTVDRPRFLEISDTKPHWEEGAYPAILAAADTPPVKRRGWLWTTLAALVVVCGGLGFWEGRAQSTHAFLGPVEVVRDGFDHLRRQLAQPEKPPVPASDSAAGNVKQPEAPPQPAASEPAAKTEPDTTAQTNPSGGAPPDANATAQAPPPGSSPVPATSTATDINAKTEPTKPIQAPPPPEPSSKPQPGQQELEKAVNASDATAAAAWLWKATSRGNPEAPVRLADMYLKGNGVPKSCEQAMVLLRSAATRENAPARNRLAALYANGTCVQRDRVRAYQLMSSALQADPTSEWAKENRQELWNQMTPAERAEAQKYR